MLLPLLFFLFSLITVCPPPLNSLTFLANNTHSTSEIIDNILTSRGVSPSLGRRWIDIVTLIGPPRTTWSNGLVQYYFEDPDARKNFEEDIKSAWDLWDKKIGKDGADSGHNLKFREFKFDDDDYP